MYNRVLKTGLKHYATDFFACSRDAGKYLFGDSILKKDNFKVLPNAIETNKYIYNCETRNRIRKEFGISNNTFVVGFVGRLYYQKNPERMIRIFNEICKKHTDSQLVIVGDYKSYSKFSELTDYAKKTAFTTKSSTQVCVRMYPMLCRHLTHLFFPLVTKVSE